MPLTGRQRVAIENIRPQVDGGRFPVKRVSGDIVVVLADVFAEGHDAVAADLLFRREGGGPWIASPMTPLGNDAWRGTFQPAEPGRYEFTVRGIVDAFATWQRDLDKRVAAQQDVAVDLQIGAAIVDAAAARAQGSDQAQLRTVVQLLEKGGENALAQALDPELALLMRANADLEHASVHEPLPMIVDRERARFSSWYERFPRSCSPQAGKHGTFADLAVEVPRIAAMGFDVLYLPPIHPIGEAHRKGRNNAVVAQEGDVGSPWAIGGRDGGHTAIDSRLGTIEDFRKLRDVTLRHGMELALDLAYQCSPDHPWVSQHPEWFRHRPDGTIQYAENPPKKYQDIYPIEFETDAWRELWQALKGVVDYWVDEGVRVFRVDNPHTKALPFWEWMIAEVKRDHPDVIFLSEAFTRPAVMYRLAKLGFTQSYTYFAWRYSKWEFEQYMTELTRTPVAEYFRPNFWPNTPDILTEQLQHGGKPTFIARLVLAATLSSSYGIYGPAFELMENRAVKPGSEEYLDSEKYQLRDWYREDHDSIADLVTAVNDARKRHPSLQRNDTLRFLQTTNDQVIAYIKTSLKPPSDPKAPPVAHDVVLTVVNLDPHWKQTAFVDVPLADFGIDQNHPFVVHDMLGKTDYVWQGSRNYIELDPHVMPAHVFHVHTTRDETDFDYYS